MMRVSVLGYLLQYLELYPELTYRTKALKASEKYWRNTPPAVGDSLHV